MAKVTCPPNIHIAVLDDKAAGKTQADLMTPGPGTPWENRQQHGLILSFLHTCLLVLFRPVKLFWAIHRPGAIGDARIFACVCGLIGMLAVCVHGAIQYRALRALETAQALAAAADPRHVKQISVNPTAFLSAWAALAFLIPLALLLFVKLGSALFSTLVSGRDMRGQAPPVLFYNIFAYCLAPVFVALIPSTGAVPWGPLAALAWFVILLMIGATRRLCIAPAAAIVNLLIVLGGATLLSVGLFYGGSFFWNEFGPGRPVEQIEGYQPPIRQLVSPQGAAPK